MLDMACVLIVRQIFPHALHFATMEIRSSNRPLPLPLFIPRRSFSTLPLLHFTLPTLWYVGAPTSPTPASQHTSVYVFSCLSSCISICLCLSLPVCMYLSTSLSFSVFPLPSSLFYLFFHLALPDLLRLLRFFPGRREKLPLPPFRFLCQPSTGVVLLCPIRFFHLVV